MKRAKNTQGISTEIINTSPLSLLGNKVSDNLFFTLAHTPLHLQSIEKNWYKTIVCLSWHDFRVKNYTLTEAWLTVRNNQQWVENVVNILNNNADSVVLVSQIAKKFFDRQTALDDYRSRIFCLLDKKSGITNKLTKWKGKIKNISVRI